MRKAAWLASPSQAWPCAPLGRQELTHAVTTCIPSMWKGAAYNKCGYVPPLRMSQSKPRTGSDSFRLSTASLSKVHHGPNACDHI